MANYEPKLIGELKDGREVYQVSAPLDEQMRAFNEIGINSLVSPKDTALIRLEGISNKFTRTNMVPVGVKGENPILYRASPFMNPAMAKIAANAHRKGNYPTLDREFYEAIKHYAQEDDSLEPEDRRAIVLSRSENFCLTHEMPETTFIFGEQARDYFDKFVPDKKITFINLLLRNVPNDKCFVNYLWLSNPEDSCLGTGEMGLNIENRGFGMLVKRFQDSKEKLLKEYFEKN